MGEWKEYKLGSDIIEIIDGDRSDNYPKQDELSNIGDVPFLNSSAFKDFKLDYQQIKFLSYEKANSLRKGKVENNDLVLTTRGNGIGKIILFKDKPFKNAILNAQMLIIRVRDPKILPKFLFHLLKSNKMQSEFSNSASGSAQPQLPIFHLKEISIVVPPIEEQIIIESILSSLDDKIDLLHRQNKTLEQLAETLFRQWFVEEADESYEEYQLKDLVYQIKPGTNAQPPRVEAGIPFLNVRNLSEGFINFSDISKVSESEYSKIHKNWQPEENDILISRIGTLGIVAVITKEDLPLIIHYNMLNLKSKLISYQFLYFLLRSVYFQEIYFSYARQSVQEYLTVEDVENIKIRLPLKERSFKVKEQSFIEFFRKIYLNRKQIRTLTQLRDTLLPKLMSGEVRVK